MSEILKKRVLAALSLLFFCAKTVSNDCQMQQQRTMSVCQQSVLAPVGFKQSRCQFTDHACSGRYDQHALLTAGLRSHPDRRVGWLAIPRCSPLQQ